MWQIRAFVAAIGFGTAVSAAGCGQPSPTPLPELGRVTRPLMSPAEQQRAIADLQARGARARAGPVDPAEAR